MEKYDEKNYRGAIMDIDGFLKRTKMKQRELAEAVGLTSGMLTAIKQGRSETTHSVCAKMLLAGMTVEELFGKDVWDAVRRQFLSAPSTMELTDSECREIAEKVVAVVTGR